MGCCDCDCEGLLERGGFAVYLCNDFDGPVGVECVKVLEEGYEDL